jgi:hypothetical protein
MSLDQVENFVRVSVAGTHDSGASTVALESGEASELPPVTDGKYNLVWFDTSGFAQPDADPNVEIVRVNSINTNNDTISVTRGLENTSATAKDTGTNYELLLTPTAKIIEDIDANKLDTTQRYTDSEAVSAIDDEVIEPDKSIHDRSISGDITLSSDDGLVLSGTVTGTGSISGDGSFSIAGGSTNVQIPENLLTEDDLPDNLVKQEDLANLLSSNDSIDASTLEGINSSGFVKTSDSIDADTFDGKDSTDFVETSDSIDADTLDGVDSTQFVQKSDSIDADTLDGADSTQFVQKSDSIDADTLDGVDSSELGGADVANNGTIVTTSTDEINFTDNIVASDDGDGTTTIKLPSEILARIFKSEDLSIHGKTLESGETVTLSDDEGAVVSEDYTVNGILNIEEGGSITVI